MAADNRKQGAGSFVLALILVSAGFALLAWYGITLTRGTGRIAALWLPNAFLVAMILRKPWEAVWPFLLTCGIANAGVGLLVGDSLIQAAGLALCNMLEVAIVYVAVRRVTGSSPDLSDIRTLGWFAVFGGLLAPVISATLAASVLSISDPAAYVENWLSWASSDALGMLIVAPLILVLAPAIRGLRMPERNRLAEWLAIMGVGSAGTAAVFFQTSYPFLFIASLFVLIAAFRLGMTGAAGSTVVVAVIATVATWAEHGPIHLVRGELHEKVIVLQVFLLCTFASAVPVASALATRDRLRARLKESRDYVESILNNIGEIVFRTDAEGRWTFLNPAWEDLTGYTIKNSLGELTTAHLIPEDYEKSRVQYPPLIEGEVDELALQQSFERADGAIRHVEVHVRALRGADGSFQGTIGNIRDVTEARVAQEELNKSRNLFQTLADFSPAGIFRTSLSGDCTYVNKSWLDLAGMTREQALGPGWASALHPEDTADVVRMWSETVEIGGDFRAQFRFLKPDGSTTWVLARATPERSGDGTILGFVGVVHNVTLLVEAREELERQKSQYKRLADYTTDAIIETNPDGVCTYASPAIEELSGYTPEEVTGVTVKIPIDEEHLDTIRQAYAEMFAGKLERTVLVYRVQHRHKGWRWHESSVQLVRNAETKLPELAVASIRDVTERVELEKQLRRARDAAETASNAKASFLANMSHEIRTPMNGVLGFADLLLDSELDDQQRQYAELISDSGRSMVALIDDILDFSKIEAGQLAIVNEPIDLRETVDGTARLMRAAAFKKGLGIDVAIDERLGGGVEGDKLRIRQILSNLVGNAIKFTDTGTISIRAELSEAVHGQVLQIAVADTGIGIAADRQTMIFDEFAQADSSTARKYGGTGLGLAISQRLARLMGGRLTVSSELGRGSTFYLEIPYVPVEAAQPKKQARPVNRRTPDQGCADKRRILVVEDHDINQLLIGSLIEKAGYPFDIAGDGVAAVEKVQQAASAGTPYALVFMDIQMPRMDGLDATRTLRSLGFSDRELPIIALTASVYASDVEECLNAGMQAHLAKPVRMDKLAGIFETWLPKRRDQDGSRGTSSSVEALRPRYNAFKQDVIAQLSLCFDGLPDPGDDQLAELERLAHKLSGSAAMFGEGEVGSMAAELEAAIKAMRADGVSGDLAEAFACARSGLCREAA